MNTYGDTGLYFTNIEADRPHIITQNKWVFEITNAEVIAELRRQKNEEYERISSSGWNDYVKHHVRDEAQWEPLRARIDREIAGRERKKAQEERIKAQVERIKTERLKEQIEELKESPSLKGRQGYVGEEIIDQPRSNVKDQSRSLVIDPSTGTVFTPAAGGVVDPRNGTFYHDVGGGYVNTKTGQFHPK